MVTATRMKCIQHNYTSIIEGTVCKEASRIPQTEKLTEDFTSNSDLTLMVGEKLITLLDFKNT